MAKNLRITQTHSIIERLEKQKRTIKALGLGRPNYVVTHPDSAALRGMINVVKHLVSVEEINK